MKNLYLICLLSSTLCFAGQSTGNGGDVVVCSGNGERSVELLDLYESRVIHGNKIIDTNLHYSAESIARHLTHKLQTDKNGGVDIYHQIYYPKIDYFHKRIKFVSDELEDISDSHHTYLPASCEIKQIAINKQNGQIVINKDLWSSLDNLNKAALILHELLYEDLLKLKYDNSIFTRFVVSNLFSKDIRKVYLYDLLLSKSYRSSLFINNISKEYFQAYKETVFVDIKLYILERKFKYLASDLEHVLFLVNELKKHMLKMEFSSADYQLYHEIGYQLREHEVWSQTENFSSEVIAKLNNLLVSKMLYKNHNQTSVLRDFMSSHLLSSKTQSFLLDLLKEGVKECDSLSDHGEIKKCIKFFKIKRLEIHNFQSEQDPYYKLVEKEYLNKPSLFLLKMIIKRVGLNKVVLNKSLEYLKSNYNHRDIAKIFVIIYKNVDLTAKKKLDLMVRNRIQNLKRFSFLVNDLVNFYLNEDLFYKIKDDYIGFVINFSPRGGFYPIIRYYKKSSSIVPDSIISSFVKMCKNNLDLDLKDQIEFFIWKTKDNKLQDLLSYYLRYRPEHLKIYEIKSMIKSFAELTMYSQSMIQESLKLNLAPEKENELKSILEILLKRKVSGSLIHLLNFIKNNHFSSKIRLIAEEVINFNNQL